MIKLKSFGLKGIKNVTKYTEINFISKKKVSNDELDDNFTKAIYGPNGSGKTAFIKGMIFYKYLVLNNNFLIKHDEYLKSYINEVAQDIVFKMIYLVEDSKVKEAKEIVHEIKLNKNLDIIYENIKMQSNVLEVKDGKIVNIKTSNKVLLKEVQDNIIDETKNLLEKSTFTSLYINKEKLMNKIDNKVDFMIKNILVAMIKTNIIVEEKDESFLDEIARHVSNYEEFRDQSKKNLEINNNILSTNALLKKNKVSYIEKWNTIEKFLKIVKPQIKGIEIEFKEKGDFLIPQVNMVYDKQKVSIDFESVGIKKLINMYDYINSLVNDDTILIIDELDAHLHDVLIRKLLEYIIENEAGQLIFTIHNLSAMDILREKSDSISMLSLDLEIVNWKKKGNSNPKNAYRLGYLTDDFGYGFFDLDEVFTIDEE